MKMGICSVCLPDLTPEQAVGAVRDLGYTGIEWRIAPDRAAAGAPSFFGYNRCTVAPTLHDVARAVELSHSAGLSVLGLDTYLDTGDHEGANLAFELAADADVPWIRVRAPWRDGRPYRELLSEALGFFAVLERLGRDHGVRALLELHQRSIAPSASLGHRLVGEFDPRWLGVIYDAGNLAIEGYEDHRLAFDLLGPHLAHVHLKNVAYTRPVEGGPWQSRWSTLDDGVVDVAGLLTALQDVGYDGWVSLEDFSTLRPPTETARFNAELLTDLAARQSAAHSL
ncbi:MULTISPECIES: sugar phosphate isomerase/epimerase [unclassified Amycolatopsis]|uniref:sugar phosphate isomerase/epimerase family protein n=1 Tax=unclassified Amycolatopsis TaxID=2618356 RepID=UPI001C695625|nr:sugar phosphate isomerase/epimerase [Amycolatopsis sp. DSM 110486]QYN18791.1 sugar phosphate isomerase/epimerase [Amycolatopsis sp. DSM 110486]